MLVVNFFAGPGAGKSTLAAATFAALKMRNINAELIQEVAKEWAWEGRPIYCQAQIFGEQLARQERLRKAGLDVIVTDSPLIQSIPYTPKEYPQEWDKFVFHMFGLYNNVNYFVERTKPFNPKGRFHDLEQAQNIDNQTWIMLDLYEIPYQTVTVNSAETIAENIVERISFGGNIDDIRPQLGPRRDEE